MCGISGKINFNPGKPVPERLIQEMNNVLSHRGPDARGIYIKNNIGLGHTRLKIIDLSENANQPMPNEDKTCWIVFNGEIYNFQELKKDLIKKGHQFISHSDTEVILHLYEDFGEKCLEHLRGMFAFAIWDEKKQKLFLARDRVGKKPLKYFVGSDFFIFASELKAILKDPDVPKEPDFEAIHHYLTFQFAPILLTGFKEIKKLPPAHYLICQNGKIEIKKYWKLDFSQKWNLSEKEWKEKILQKLEESVKLRMISDAPLGAMLSGGTDSSAIVALMSQFSQKPVETFSIGFEEESFNELPYAKIIAEKFKTNHHEFIVKPDAIEILPKLAYYYEEPYADSSAIPSFYLSGFTRKYVKVALNGDGGDENFAGYNRYNILKLFDFLRKTRFLNINLTKQILFLIVQIAFPLSKREKIIKFIKQSSNSPEKAYLQIVSCFNAEEKEKIYTDSFKNKIKKFNSFEILKERFKEANSFDFLDKIFYMDINLYLPEDLLVKMDIATMANSLEARSPLLDHQFMELTAKIPSNLKLKGMNKKYIFKKTLEKILPKEIIYRKKMGFGAPIEIWFKRELKNYIYDILTDKKFLSREIFKKESIKKILDEHTQNKKNNAYQIWSLLFLEHWFQEYFD